MGERGFWLNQFGRMLAEGRQGEQIACGVGGWRVRNVIRYQGWSDTEGRVVSLN